MLELLASSAHTAPLLSLSDNFTFTLTSLYTLRQGAKFLKVADRFSEQGCPQKDAKRERERDRGNGRQKKTAVMKSNVILLFKDMIT